MILNIICYLFVTLFSFNKKKLSENLPAKKKRKKYKNLHNTMIFELMITTEKIAKY